MRMSSRPWDFFREPIGNRAHFCDLEVSEDYVEFWGRLYEPNRVFTFFRAAE